MNQIILRNGCCLDWMWDIQDESVDLIIADLPYGTTRSNWDSVIDVSSLWKHYERVAKKDAPIVLTAAQPFTSFLVQSNLKLFRYEWIWEKTHATGHLNAKIAPLRAHESILIFCKGSPKYYPQKTIGHERKVSKKKPQLSGVYGEAKKITQYDSTERFPRSVQKFKSDKQRINIHPNQKPVELIVYLLKTYSLEGDFVLDNCFGSGTTAIACMQENRIFYGIEKDLSFYNSAINRIKNFQGKQ